jgi:cytochrome c-type biogenesis protein
MDAETLRQTIAHAGFAAVGIAFLAGLAFSFNPVSMAAIPVSLAYVTKARERKEAVLFAAMFMLGMVVTHGLLGFAAGLGGHWVASLVGRAWGLVLGPLLIVLGLMWPGWLKIPLPAIAFRARRPMGPWGAFLLGIPFSIAVCPVCTPALVVMLGVSAGLGAPLLGVALLLAFALGRIIPVGIGAVAVGWLENLRGVAAYRRGFEVAGGLILIAAGVYMLNAFFIWIPGLAA